MQAQACGNYRERKHSAYELYLQATWQKQPEYTCLYCGKTKAEHRKAALRKARGEE